MIYWIMSGVILSIPSLIWARSGWLELDRLNGHSQRATSGEVAFGFLTVPIIALLGLGLLVPLCFVFLRLFWIEPALRTMHALEEGKEA